MPFRLTAAIPDERSIHETCAALLDRLLLPPAMWFAYPAGVIELRADQVARLVRFGLKRALPDIWILHFGVYCIELKVPGGKLSKSRVGRTSRGSPRFLIGQEESFPLLLATGAIRAIAVCTGPEEMLAQCRKWGVPLRPHSLGG